MTNSTFPQTELLKDFSEYKSLNGKPDAFGWWSAKEKAILRKDTTRALKDEHNKIVDIRGCKSSARRDGLEYGFS